MKKRLYCIVIAGFMVMMYAGCGGGHTNETNNISTELNSAFGTVIETESAIQTEASEREVKITYSNDELDMLKEDGLTDEEIKELEQLNWDLEDSEKEETATEEIETEKMIDKKKNVQISDMEFDIAILEDNEIFCYQEDDVIMGIHVELAAILAEYMDSSFELHMNKSIEKCYRMSDVDCILVNDPQKVDGYLYFELHKTSKGKSLQCAVKEEQKDLLDKIKKAAKKMKADRVYEELERSYQ